MTNKASHPKRPTHRLYQVEGEGETAFWRPIGSAWAHADGKGYGIACSAVPLTGRIVLRAIKSKGAQEVLL